MAKANGALPKPWGRRQGRVGVVRRGAVSKAVGAWQGRGEWLRPWWRGQGHADVAMTVGSRSRRGAVSKAVGAWTKPWGRSHGRGGVSNVLRAWPRTCGLGQVGGGVAKAVETLPRL